MSKCETILSIKVENLFLYQLFHLVRTQSFDCSVYEQSDNHRVSLMSMNWSSIIFFVHYLRRNIAI